MYMLTTDLLLLTMTLTNDRPALSSEMGPHMDKTVTNSNWYLVSTPRPTDRRSQRDFDLIS
jgi:hypothetical protein